MKHDNGYDRYGCNDCVCIPEGKFFMPKKKRNEERMLLNKIYSYYNLKS